MHVKIDTELVIIQYDIWNLPLTLDGLVYVLNEAEVPVGKSNRTLNKLKLQQQTNMYN